eukprot:TRINITY_DN10653_c4_g1_i1.p1 TRINITY_DN10653_c4_g1~~TRINITY_DN10653_c4_g1_i1.p1  ORF type:complete len:579 (+),score=155.38 TRINITY_DN10653_c4_g1_i1:175-1911(+)
MSDCTPRQSSAVSAAPSASPSARISDSIARLHAELGRAREQQMEAHRLLAQAAESPPRALFAQASELRTPTARTPLPADRSRVFPDACTATTRSFAGPTQPNYTSPRKPPSEPTPVPAPVNPPTPVFAPFGQPSAPMRAAPAEPPRAATPCIVSSGAANRRSPSARPPQSRGPHQPATNRCGPYADVEPRYQLPRRPPSPRADGAHRKQYSTFMAGHAAMARAMGFGGAVPRIYAAAEDHAALARERREAEQAGRSTPRERPRDPVLEQHARLAGKLGYHRVKTRVYESPFAGFDLASSNGGGGGRMCGAKARSASADSRPRSPCRRYRSSSAVSARRSCRPTGSAQRRSSSLQSAASLATTVCQDPPADAKADVAPLVHPPSKAARIPDATASVRAAARGCPPSEDTDALLAAAAALERDGQPHKAESLHVEVLKVRKSRYGMHHDSVTASFLGLAALSEAAELLPAAENYFREALQTCLRLHNDVRHPDARRALRGQSRALLGLKRFTDAAPKLQLQLELMRETHSADHKKVCEARSMLAAALDGTGRDQEARELVRLNENLGYKNRSRTVQESGT